MEGLVRGDRIDDKYQIDAPIGQGGMGAVYRATHLGTTRTVALKIIHPQFSNHDEFVERFRREAEAAGRLRHPNVVDVTDFGFAETRGARVAYLVMEYLDGCTLADVLEEEGRLATSWVVDILEQVSSAADAAHRLGILHRDLKPENIWLEPNRRGGYTVKVLDFGLAKLAGRVEPFDSPGPGLAQGRPIDDAMTMIQPSGETMAQGATRVGAVVGTPLYMSPEQCRGEPLDARSDIYSVGVIAYRMIAGRTPFSGSAAELIRQHTTVDAPPMGQSRVPARLAAVVMSALSKAPGARPSTAAGFASALRASAEGSGTLLRQAVSLYSEHFPMFLTISLLAHIPLIICVVFFNLGDRGLIPFAQSNSLLAAALFFVMILANLFAYFTVSAATIPMVVQATMAPLREMRLGMAFAALRRRWLRFLACTVIVIAGVAVGSLLLVLPGIVFGISHALYAPVVMMERSGVWSSLKRARSLTKRYWSAVLVITVLQFTLPVLVWIASVDSSLNLEFADDWSPKAFGFQFATSGSASLYQLLNILMAPLTAIMGAELYMKTRQAGGEILSDAVAEFEALEIPRSRWQARMRRPSTASASRNPAPSGNDAIDFAG